MATKTSVQKSLTDAASFLEVLNLDTDVAPDCNLSDAYDTGLSVWKESAGLFDGKTRNNLRLHLLRVRAVRDAITANKLLTRTDKTSVTQAAAFFREVASSIKVELKKDPELSKSALGLRMSSLKELADAKPFVLLDNAEKKAETAVVAEDELDHEIQVLKNLNSFKAKLPKKVLGADFTIVRMPLIIVTSKPIVNTGPLVRTGVKWMQIRSAGARKEGGVMHKKLSSESSHVLILENQIIAAMNPDAVEDKKIPESKMFGIKKGIVRRGEATKVEAGAAKRAIRVVSNKLGEHVNGLDSLDQKYIRSPGNPLVFMWLVSRELLGPLKGLGIRSASFPWLSPSTVEKEEDHLVDLRKRKQLLEEQITVLNRRSVAIPADVINALRQVNGEIDAYSGKPTLQQRQDRVANLREQLESEMKTRYKKEFDQLDALNSAIRKAENAEEKRKLAREKRKLESNLAHFRELIATRLRAKR